MKHVLSLSTFYPHAAAPRLGTFVARSMEALAQRCAPESEAWRVTVVNPIGLPPVAIGRYRPLAELPLEEQWGGLSVHRPRFTLIPKIGGRRNAAAIARAVLPLARRLHTEQPFDLIDAQFFFPDGPAAALIARDLGVPLTIKARGYDINYWGKMGFAKAQMLKAARAASGMLAVSGALADAMEQMGLERSKVQVHYTGLDRDLFRPLGHTQLRAQLSTELGFTLPERAPVLACVGALIERKGQAVALRALADLSTDYPASRLLLVGRGEDEAMLRALAEELGLSARVHFTGAIDHTVLPIILSASDAMVLPTSGEGLANAWVEALACGTPVITCDVGGAHELIRDEAAGQLVARDPAAFAAALRAVLAEPPDPHLVAASAERFDWRVHADELAAYYVRLIAA